MIFFFCKYFNIKRFRGLGPQMKITTLKPNHRNDIKYNFIDRTVLYIS